MSFPLRPASALIALAFAACKPRDATKDEPNPRGLPGHVAAVASAAPVDVQTVESIEVSVPIVPGVRVARIDLDGDGADEVAIVGEEELTVVHVQRSGASKALWTIPAVSGPSEIASGDVDGDGKDDLVIGWGEGRLHRTAKPILTAYLSTGSKPGERRAETVSEPTSERSQFTTIAPANVDGQTGLLWAVFISKYLVSARFSVHEGTTWKERELTKPMRMGQQWASIRFAEEPPVLVVGRPYGDGAETFGDVRELRSNGKLYPIPSTRGIQSLAVVDVGRKESPTRLLCYGAGWHWEYKKEAKGILTCARRSKEGAWSAQVVDQLPTYQVSTIAAGDLDGDGRRELLASAPDGLHSYTLVGEEGGQLTWVKRLIGPALGDMTVLDVDGDGADEIIGPDATQEPALLLVRARLSKKPSAAPSASGAQ